MLTKWFVPPLIIPAGLFILVVVVRGAVKQDLRLVRWGA